MQIDIDRLERLILLASLNEKRFKAKIQEPRTPFRHRRAYESLRDKVINAEKLSQEISKTV